MKSAPKVSVIVPVFNTAKYIAQCLKSIVNQSLKEIEIIIIDDGSTDNPEKVIKEFSQKDDRIIFLKKQNSGLANTYNMGVQQATGDFLVFVDSDDWIQTNALEILHAKAVEEGSDIVLFRYKIFYESNNKTTDTKPLYKVMHIPEYPLSLATCPDLFKISTSSCIKLFLRSLIIDNGIVYPSGLKYEDVPFCYQSYYYARSVSIVDESFYYYRIRSKSITSDTSEALFDIVQIYKITDDFFLHNRIQTDAFRVYSRKKISVLLNSFYRIDRTHKRKFFKRLVASLEESDTLEQGGLSLFLSLQLYLAGKKQYSLFCLVNRMYYCSNRLLTAAMKWIAG